MEPYDRLMQSINDLKERLDSCTCKWVGASEIAQLAQLRVLVNKYPAHAREFVAEEYTHVDQSGR